MEAAELGLYKGIGRLVQVRRGRFPGRRFAYNANNDDANAEPAGRLG
jgi:hypothetical protein